MNKVKFLKTLQTVIDERLKNPEPGSYTARMASKGQLKVAQKVGEEAVELALASMVEKDDRVRDEAADLLYHVLLLLSMRGIRIADVVAELERRHDEKVRPV